MAIGEDRLLKIAAESIVKDLRFVGWMEKRLETLYCTKDLTVEFKVGIADGAICLADLDEAGS